MEEQMNEMITEQKKEQKPGVKIAKAIGVSVLLLILFYAIQFALTIGVMVVSAVVKIANGGDAAQVMMTMAQDSEFLTLVTTVTTFATAVVYGIWYKCTCAKKFGKEKWVQLGHKLLNLRTIMFMVFSAIAVYMLSNIIITVMDQVAHETVSSYVEMMGLTMGGNPVLVFLTLVVLAPIGEECLFRGLILGRLQKSMPILAALIIESVLFGIFHANPVQGIYVISLGMVTGYIVYKKKSVVPGIIIHAINNGMGYITALLPEEIQNSTAALVAIFAAAVLFTVFAWKFMEDKTYGAEE